MVVKVKADKQSRFFGQHLKRLRDAANLTLRELEALTGVSNAYLSQIERDRVGPPSPRIIKRIANALGADYFGLLNAAGHLPSESSHGLMALGASSMDLSGLTPRERQQVFALVSKLRSRRSIQSVDLSKGGEEL